MSTYRKHGASYLVCPRLLKLDPRHGEHPSKWPDCRRGGRCTRRHKHESLLVDPEGHSVNLFLWVPGCRPPTDDEHPVCSCGSRLVHSDLDDLYDPKHLAKENALPLY